MLPSTFLLEVVVGELSLTPHLPQPVTSPTVCVQVRSGPPLVIPYLPPSFSTTFGQPETQPSQFRFQRGKSCIFSAPRHPFVASEGVKVKVEVVCSGSGGVGVQGALVGCHEGRLVPQGESSMHMGLRGTLSLRGRDRESVGAISLSISLKCLGVEVPGGDTVSHTPVEVPGTYEESFSVLQDVQVPYENLPASERIALKIASLQDPASFQGPMRAALGERQDLQAPRWERELAQPPPILYLGRDAEGERMWEEKMALMGQATETQEQGVDSEVGERLDGGQDTDSDTPSRRSIHTSTRPTTRTRKAKHPHRSPIDMRRQPHKHTQSHSPSSRPHGWLRSTPLAPQSTAKPPRLNRTHLLRLAASNAQLDRNLKAEVERRVKNRVRDLEGDFLNLIGKLAKKRKCRMNYGTPGSAEATRPRLKSVGCQTDSATETRVPGSRMNEGCVSPQSPLVPRQVEASLYDTSPHRHTSPLRHTPPPPQTRSPHHSSNTKGTQTDTKQTPTNALYVTKKTEAELAANTLTGKHTLTESSRSTFTDGSRHKVKDSGAEPLPDTPGAETSTDPRTERPREAAETHKQNTRLLLGDIPKNLTYVIGPDGERVYQYAELEEVAGGHDRRQMRDGDTGRGEGVMREEERDRKERGGREEKEEAGERRHRGRGEKQRERRQERRRREEEDSERELERRNYRLPHTSTSSSPSSSSSSSTPPPEPPKTPRPPQHPFLTTGDEQLLREPSQDTWGLTYTIHPAEQHSSTPTRKSTPSTHLSSPSVDASGSGEVEENVEEVSSASSLSNEVFREIYKGRKADILSAIANSPPQSVGESLLSPPTSGSHSQTGGVMDDSPGSTSRASSHSRMQKSTTNEDVCQTKASRIHKASGGGHSGTINGTSSPPSASARSSATSISDISARIAALLVARKIEVPRLNTESVSSYVPSDQPGTLSSMSDILVSSSSSSSSSG